MKFKLDENLHPDAGESLKQRGHDVSSVYDQGPQGRRDPEIIEVCRLEGRVLISLDLDFFNVRLYPPTNYPGLIVLRLRATGRSAVQRVIERLIGHFDQEPLAGRLWIVDELRIRIHRVRDDEVE